ncbi:MAG: hypothetical protein JXL81_09670 [Deltaproteobacteria bacterium]|nr:hypothetical protein [Deltaproteobacteria bacterium]
MTNYIKHPFLDKIISLIISIIIVLIIFVGIVGIVFPLMLEARVEHVKIISLITTLIGALIVLLARRWPLVRFISFIKKNKGFDTKVYDFIGSLIAGLSFLAAGVLYMRTKNPNMMIIPFIIGALLVRLMILHINHKIKEQSRPSSSLHKENNAD